MKFAFGLVDAGDAIEQIADFDEGRISQIFKSGGLLREHFSVQESSPHSVGARGHQGTMDERDRMASTEHSIVQLAADLRS